MVRGRWQEQADDRLIALEQTADAVVAVRAEAWPPHSQ